MAEDRDRDTVEGRTRVPFPPPLLDGELVGFAQAYGACRDGIAALAREEEREEGRELRLAWPVIIAPARARQTWFGVDAPFGNFRTSVYAELSRALAELPPHEDAGGGGEGERSRVAKDADTRLDREVAAVLATRELERRHEDLYSMQERHVRRIGKPYFEEALRAIRRANPNRCLARRPPGR